MQAEIHIFAPAVVICFSFRRILTKHTFDIPRPVPAPPIRFMPKRESGQRAMGRERAKLPP